MMKNLFANKKLWIGIDCGTLAIVLLVGIILMTGCNGINSSNPTLPSSTTPSGNVTEPSGTTVVGDATNPNEPDPTIPTGTPDNPGQDDEPLKPDDYIEPVDPEPTIPEPTDPEPDVDAPEPTDDPDIGPTYNFGGYDYGSLTAEVWESWDWDTKMAFVKEFDATATPEEQHNFFRQTQYGGYSCGFEKHTCFSQDNHDDFMQDLARGCEYCGKSDCESYFVVDPITLFTRIDRTHCPEYDAHKDPQFYCQTCGLPHVGESGDVVCNMFIVDTNCDYCGEPVKAHQCHECIQP